jgi:hypothetical protein
MTGDPSDPHYVPVNPKVLGAGLAARHAVPKLDIATLVLNFPQSQGLDDGELHLLAFLYRHGVSEDAAILVSTADKAAVASLDSSAGSTFLFRSNRWPKSPGTHDRHRVKRPQ